MKTLVLLCVLSVGTGVLSETNTQETPQKNLAKTTLNAIPTVPKQEQQYYLPHQVVPSSQQQYVPVQFIQKPQYVAQNHQQPAMLIIAQPAIVPQQMLYTNAMQHILNYFHNNPQARYQFLNHLAQQSQVPQQQHTYNAVPMYQYVPTQQAAGSSSNYHASTQQYQVPSVPAQYSFVQPQYSGTQNYVNNLNHGTTNTVSAASQASTNNYGTNYQAFNHHSQPLSLNHISSLAHSTAQNFYKTTPPIITGLEQFTPEQQAQIKAQLNTHLGTGTPISTISSNHLVLPSKSAHGDESTTLQQYGAKLTQKNQDDGTAGSTSTSASGTTGGASQYQTSSPYAAVYQQKNYQNPSYALGTTQQQQSYQQSYSQQETTKSDSQDSNSDFVPSVGYKTYTKG